MLNIVLILCGLILLALSFVVLYSNYTAKSNRWLSAFILSGFLWLLANLLANSASSVHSDLVLSRAALVGASLLPYTFLMFCISFIEHPLRRRTKLFLAVP